MAQIAMGMGMQYHDEAASAKSVLLQNFDLEASERRRMIEQELAAGLATLKRQLEREMARLAKGAAAHLTAAQFLEIHGASIDNVAKQNNVQKVRRNMDDIELDIERTVKKRKRVPNAANASPEKINNNSELDAGNGSPSKPRKNMRMAPPTPSRNNTASSTASLGIAKSASRTRLVSAGSRVSSATFNNNTSNAGASTSNFIYRARPSAVNPYSINPRLPQTPQFRSGSIFTSSSKTVTAADGNKTAKRMPRRNESIQAYSMNGSPLGVLDIAVDKTGGESSSAHPSSDNTEGIEADWEVLQPRTSIVPQSVPFPSLHNTASKSSISPSKLLRKTSAATLTGGGSNGGGGGASSTFKAAIVAGANRVKAKTSSSSLNSRIFGGGHHSNSNNNNGDFTFQAPSMLSPGKSKTDWENWARSFKAELEGMNMNPEDKRRLERRMMELVQK